MTAPSRRWFLPSAAGIALLILVCHPGMATLTAFLLAGAAWAHATGYRITRKEDPR